MLTDGRFPHAAYKLFQEHGAPNPHDYSGPLHDRKEDSDNDARGGASSGGFYTAASGYVAQGSRVSRTYLVQECRLCASCKEKPGSSSWWGAGRFAYLVGDTRDPPFRGAVPPMPRNDQ